MPYQITGQVSVDADQVQVVQVDLMGNIDASNDWGGSTRPNDHDGILKAARDGMVEGILDYLESLGLDPNLVETVVHVYELEHKRDVDTDVLQ